MAILVYIGFLLAKPYRECRWCHPKRGRTQRCWRCKGTRYNRRWGAGLVHKAELSPIQAWDEREWWQ